MGRFLSFSLCLPLPAGTCHDRCHRCRARWCCVGSAVMWGRVGQHRRWSQRGERGWQAVLKGVGVDLAWAGAPGWEEDSATR